MRVTLPHHIEVVCNTSFHCALTHTHTAKEFAWKFELAKLVARDEDSAIDTTTNAASQPEQQRQQQQQELIHITAQTLL